MQVYLQEAGVLQTLIRMLSTEQSGVPLRTRVLYALSSLLRHFPHAQKDFLQQGGLQALSGLFESEAHGSVKLQLKAITLINDLVTEKVSVCNIT